MEHYKILAFLRGDIAADEMAKEFAKQKAEEKKLADERQAAWRAEQERRREERRKFTKKHDDWLANDGSSGLAGNLELLRTRLRGDAPFEGLRYWLILDSWTPFQAFSVLCGHSPEYIDFDESGNLLTNIRGEFYGLSWLNGLNVDSTIVEEVLGEEFQRKLKTAFSDRVKHLYSIWQTGTHQEQRYAPAYYIEWAQRKNFEIAWLDWARSEGLLTWEKKQADTDADLHPRKESSYLVLIGSLCDLYWKERSGDEKFKLDAVLKALETYGFDGMSQSQLKRTLPRALTAIKHPNYK
jgi:hypothetical protein